ncbi:MAG TPA: hypothetical protein VF623_02725 [Segetibacter sp.]|jgi:hypothetical protein
MNISRLLFGVCFFIGCRDKLDKKSALDFKTELKKPLTEISGLVADGKNLWAITDKPKANVYLLDTKGNLKQEVRIKNFEALDVEAVTADSNFIYIGDLGDNDGTREERQIIKASKSAIGKDRLEEIDGEVITFIFSDAQTVDKKKKNNYDCEALLSFGDSLYLFTKRREDQQTEVFSLPKTAGKYTARSLGTFNTKGLVTDAAINKEKNEIALCGYHKGHKYPFILLLKNFSGNNFFSGTTELINLANKAWDWQIEGITYSNDGKVYFACEETKEVKSTLYEIDRSKILEINKKSNDE